MLNTFSVNEPAPIIEILAFKHPKQMQLVQNEIRMMCFLIYTSYLHGHNSWFFLGIEFIQISFLELCYCRLVHIAKRFHCTSHLNMNILQNNKINISNFHEYLSKMSNIADLLEVNYGNPSSMTIVSIWRCGLAWRCSLRLLGSLLSRSIAMGSAMSLTLLMYTGACNINFPNHPYFHNLHITVVVVTVPVTQPEPEIVAKRDSSDFFCLSFLGTAPLGTLVLGLRRFRFFCMYADILSVSFTRFSKIKTQTFTAVKWFVFLTWKNNNPFNGWAHGVKLFLSLSMENINVIHKTTLSEGLPTELCLEKQAQTQMFDIFSHMLLPN